MYRAGIDGKDGKDIYETYVQVMQRQTSSFGELKSAS